MTSLIITYVLTYGGAAVAVLDPFIGLLIYVAFGILKPEKLWFWSVPQGNYSRTVAIALLVGWVVRGFGKWRFGRARLVVVSLVGFWLWSMLSALQAPNQDVAWHWVESISKILLPVLVGLTTIDSVSKLKQLAWVITLSAGYLAYTENERYVLLSGLEAFDNEIAHIMTVGTGVAFFLGLQSKHWWEKLIAFACAALMVHTVMFHMSRGAMLGIGVVGVATFVIVPKKPRDLALYALAIIVGLQLAGPSVRSEFSTIFSSDRKVQNDGGRRQLWADMWDAANRNVVFGLGPGHWPVVAREYGWPAGKQGHGLWPQILAETGFPGGILYASVFATPILLLWRHARRGVKDGDETLVWFARMAIASLAGFIVQELFGSFVGLEIAYYVVMLGGGTLKLISLAPAQDRSAALTRELLGDWSRVRPQHVEVYG